MSARTVKTTDWARMRTILDELAKEKDVNLVAPVKAGVARRSATEGEEVLFRAVSNFDEICLDYTNSLVPPKTFLTPPYETLLSFLRRDGGWELVEEGKPPEMEETVVFGIRSCDVAAFSYMERLYSGALFNKPELADERFMRRRQNMTLISMVCQQPAPTCFCVCCQGGPYLEDGFDWQITDLGERLLCEVGSEKGQSLLNRFATAFDEATDDDLSLKERLMEQVRGRFGEFNLPSGAALRRISKAQVLKEVWEQIGERCLGCGGCSFVCPACTCFTVTDTPADGEGEVGRRIRVRDSCALAGFSRLAGGIYPHSSLGDRRKHRFFHKLSWQFLSRMGRSGCVGCGRCVITCPGGIHIADVANRIKETVGQGALASEVSPSAVASVGGEST